MSQKGTPQVGRVSTFITGAYNSCGVDRPTGADGDPSLNGHRTPSFNARGKRRSQGCSGLIVSIGDTGAKAMRAVATASPRAKGFDCMPLQSDQCLFPLLLNKDNEGSQQQTSTSPILPRFGSGGGCRQLHADDSLDNTGRLPRGLDAPKLAL